MKEQIKKRITLMLDRYELEYKVIMIVAVVYLLVAHIGACI